MVCKLYVKALQRQVSPWELLSPLNRQGKLQRIRLVKFPPPPPPPIFRGINKRTLHHHLKDLMTMHTSCWEYAGAQTCYLPHLTTQAAMVCRRGLSSILSQSMGSGKRRSHARDSPSISRDSSLTLLSYILPYFSREVSTVCPWGQEGGERPYDRVLQMPKMQPPQQARKAKVKRASHALST